MPDFSPARNEILVMRLSALKCIMRVSSSAQRLTGSMPMHPLPAVMNQGVHVALCSDDPAVFGNMGLTFDFYQVSPTPTYV